MGQRGSDLAGAERQERLRRVLVHASGFRQSPYADISPQGVAAADTRAQAGAERDKAREKELVEADETAPLPPGTQPAGKQPSGKQPSGKQPSGKQPPGKLWHSSPGSSGW